MSQIVNEIYKDFNNQDLDESDENYLGYNISEKLEYNKVVEFKPIINDYKVYHGYLSDIYELIESQGSTKKQVVLLKIKNTYLRKRGEIQRREDISGLEAAQNFSDEILKNIFDDFEKKIIESKNIDAPVELIEIGIYVIIVDGFIRCKILEEPKQ